MKNDEYFSGQTLAITIEDTKEQSYDGGQKGVTIFVRIDNKTKSVLNVTLPDGVTILTSSKEQRTQDSNLTGFSDTEVDLKPNSHFVHGYIFFEQNSVKFSKGWTLYAHVKDTTNNTDYNLTFRATSIEPIQWEVIDCKITKNADNTKEKSIELKHCVERIEAFENKLNIRLENISIKPDDGVQIYFDVYSCDGKELANSVTISAVAYDENNMIMAKDSTFIDNDKFMGFGTYSCKLRNLNFNNISKIRLYPSKGYIS